jgi:hypothetical protein
MALPGKRFFFQSCKCQTRFRNGRRKYSCASVPRNLELPAAGAKGMCAELDALKREAAQVLREVRNTRRSRDVSFYEDAELNGEKDKSVNALIRHLLVGHEGKPCPAGDRPIVGQGQDRRQN